MKSVFICGTDTGVGKTYITGRIFKELSDKGLKVVTQKWVQTGSIGFSRDIAQHLKIAGKSKKYIKDILPLVNPYSFRLASSPHLAARMEKKKIDVNKIKSAFKRLLKMFDFVIVEGVGGALVPLNEKTLVIDIVNQLKIPVIVVAANRLGTVNHTLMTVEALKKRKIKILGIVFNNMQEDQDPKILKDNPLIISELAGVPVLGTLPYKG